MNIKALRAFRLTLTEGSIAAASNKMHLSQSAISRLISNLEAELHLTLFIRKGKRLEATSEAREFYQQAGKILENLDDIRDIAAKIRAGRRETLRILAMPRIAPSIVAPAVAHFRQLHPEVAVSLDIRTRRDANEWLVGREYDIGIGALPIEHPEINTEVLLKVRTQAVMPSGHPLSKKATLSAEDLVNEPLITLTSGLLLRGQTEDFFHSAGLAKEFDCEVASSQMACHLVANGAGITLADSLTVGVVDHKKVCLRPLIPERWMAFGLLLPKEQPLTSAGKAFIETLRQSCKNVTSDMVQS